jgi:hypothetical protein
MTDGVVVVWVGVEVGIPFLQVGSSTYDAEERQEGADAATTDQRRQRRPRHP